ncbi:MAG: 30S ribosomal protein S3, partial [Planctomycetota bacterium]
GKKIEFLTADLEHITGKTVKIDIIEVKNPEKNAQLVAENIAEQLERRASFRRVMKKAVELAMKAGVQGVKIQVAGRLGGADMARTESINQGKIPLQTLRAQIDYGFAEAETTYGIIGIKVWFYHGDLITSEEQNYATT